MDRRPALVSSTFKNYQDFTPPSAVVQEEKSDTLIINLPEGFKKEHIRVQIDGFGTLKISGERPIGDNKWSRFRKDYRTAPNCKTSEIRAKFENLSLHIIMPKTVTTTTTTTPKPPTRQEPLASPPPPPPPSQRPTITTPPPPVVLPPPSQKPAATESSNVSPRTPVADTVQSQKPGARESSQISSMTPPVGGQPLSPKPTSTTQPTVSAPPPTMQTEPSQPSQISSVATPTTKAPDGHMEPKTDQHEGHHDQEVKQKKKVTMNGNHEYIDQEGNKHFEKGQNWVKEHMSGSAGGVGKMKDDLKEKVMSHIGGGGTSGTSDKTLSSIMEDYKTKIEGFMMELKKKTSASSSSDNINRSELLVNMAVASLVVVALGVYATWNFKSSSWNNGS